MHYGDIKSLLSSPLCGFRKYPIQDRSELTLEFLWGPLCGSLWQLAPDGYSISLEGSGKETLFRTQPESMIKGNLIERVFSIF
jgi:hypothetical protein